MSVADGGGGGLPPGTWWAVNTGIKVLGNVLGGGPKGPTNADRAALEAAGYRFGAYRGPGNVVDPPKGGKFVPVWFNETTGDLIGNKSARGYARGVAPTVQPPQNVVVNPPPPTRPPPLITPPVVYEPPRIPPRSSPPLNYPRGTPPINPTGNVGPIVPVFDVGGALERIWDINSVLTTGINRAIFGPRPIPKGPTTRPVIGGNPFPPQGSPPQQQPIVINMPTPQPPRSERVQAAYDSLGGDIFVSTRRLPIPAPVPATPPPKPLWQQLLGTFGPALLPFILPDQGNRSVLRLTDPLTQPQGLTRSETTNVSSYSAFGGGSSGAVGTNTCECKAPRKKGRRKKRTVCYSGTFIERADGTRKTKKRKVKC